MRVRPSRHAEYRRFVVRVGAQASERQQKCMDIAHRWAELMEEKILADVPLADVALFTLAELNPDCDGQLWLTEYTSCVEFLAVFWLWGKGLREWHNKHFCTVATCARFNIAEVVFPIEIGMNRATGGRFSRVVSLNAFLKELGTGKVA